MVGGGFGGGAGGLAKPDYLDDDEAEIGPDGLPMLGSDFGGLINNLNPYNKDYAWDRKLNRMMPKRSSPIKAKAKASSSSKILPFLLPAHSRPVLADKKKLNYQNFNTT